ncbi:MAG TPA: ABC transporter permease [Bryobacteraceae bacterium]|nr:ABC transporter permease [Bryobacteraceae bacterium]
MLQDLRYALRSFGKNPGFTLAAVLSIAIGIGANTGIFSVTNALLLRPLPYKDADRLVILWNRSPGLNITQDWFSTAQYFDIKNGSQAFEQLAIALGGLNNLTGEGEPERVGTARVSSNLLPMFGAHAALGRLFLPEEDAPGRAPTAVLTDGMWRRRFGADPRVVGRSLTINGIGYEVVGVLPPGFALSHEVLPVLGGGELNEIFLPLPLGADARDIRTHEDYTIVGTFRREAMLRQAQVEMDLLTAHLRRDHPDVYPPNGGLTFSIVPLLEWVVGDVRYTLLILLGSVAFVLLIACANVANLLLSRAVARQKEIALRIALGAGQTRILRQLLTESVLLSLAGGAAGIVLAMAGLRWVQVAGPKSVPRVQDIAIDGRVLLFTFLLSLLSGVLFGLTPAWRAAQSGLQTSAVWGRGHRLRRGLVISELALSVVLLIGAGLLIRSFASLVNVAPGFQAKNVLTLELTMANRRYTTPPVVLETYRQLWERLEHLPGVTAAGGITGLPLSEMWEWGPITVEGRIPPPGENFINADQHIVSGHYFQAMLIPLVRGRFFSEQDTGDKPRVVIVDESMAQQMWPGQDAIGKRLRYGGLDSKSPWLRVVGVVGRVKQYALETDSRIAVYFPHLQSPTRRQTVVIRSASDPAALAAAVKREIHELDSDLPVYNIRTMEQRVADSLARRRFTMTLLGLFAVLALALAGIGIYGVMAYLVSQGTREIGIRMALGSSEAGVLRLIVGRGMSLALAGIGVGLAAALALTRFMNSLLFGVRASDPLTFGAIAVLLGLVAFVASFVPGRRAARVDPMVSLRAE